MKKSTQGESTLHKLGGLLTRNFGLKSLSLALAIVIYVVLSTEINHASYDTLIRGPGSSPAPASAEAPAAVPVQESAPPPPPDRPAERPAARPAVQPTRPPARPQAPASVKTPTKSPQSKNGKS